jgi:hypothetical protein
MLNPGVLYNWPSRREGIPWWYVYSINSIKPWVGCHNPRHPPHPPWRMMSLWFNPKLGMNALGHVRTSSTGICTLYIQLAAYVSYCIPPTDPRVMRTYPHPWLIRYHIILNWPICTHETMRVSSNTICNNPTTLGLCHTPKFWILECD